MEYKSVVTIQSFNPHEATHPGHKVVCEETLTLIKFLRAQGTSVIVEPEDGRPVEYLFRKGLQQFFSDPIIIGFGVGFTSKIAADLVLNGFRWIWQHRRKEHIVQEAPEPRNIILINRVDNSVFSCDGKALD